MESSYPAFDPDARCPKCGGEHVTAQYHPLCEEQHCTGKPGQGCGRCHVWTSGTEICPAQGEHIYRGCQRCSYHWFERPLDTATAEAKKQLPTWFDHAHGKRRRPYQGRYAGAATYYCLHCWHERAEVELLCCWCGEVVTAWFESDEEHGKYLKPVPAGDGARRE